MMAGLMSFLRGRKQAHLGRPASAITYDPVKGRYVIDGESESDDEPPPPPPKKETKVEEKPKEEIKEVSGLNAFTQVAPSIRKGRGGRGPATRGARPSNSAAPGGRPSQPLVPNLSTAKKPTEEERKIE